MQPRWRSEHHIPYDKSGAAVCKRQLLTCRMGFRNELLSYDCVELHTFVATNANSLDAKVEKGPYFGSWLTFRTVRANLASFESARSLVLGPDTIMFVEEGKNSPYPHEVTHTKYPWLRFVYLK